MPGTAFEIRREMLARLPWLEAIEVEIGDGLVTLHVAVAKDAPENADAKVTTAAEEIRPAGIRYQVSIGTVSATVTASLPETVALASLNSDISSDGLTRSLLRLVPSLARVSLEDVRGGKLRVLVADFEGNASPQLLDRVRVAASAIVGAGIGVEVGALGKPRDDLRGGLERAGILIPRRNRGLVDFTEQDQDTYATRLRRLVDGKGDRVPVVDSFAGTSIVCTSTIGGDAPVPCFLPVYDRLYLEMPPTTADENDTAEYLRKHFGLSEADFFLYCARGKIVPIFKFDIGLYPEKLARRILEDLSLAMVSPRELDFIAARYSWQNAEYIRALRDDRALSAAAHERLRELETTADPTDAHRLAIEVLRFALRAATSFEGTMWHKGHIFAGDFSPAAPLVRMAHIKFDPKDATMVSLDTMSSAQTVAVAQAFGASAYCGHSMHGHILELVNRFFSGREAISTAEGKKVKHIIEALELAYSTDVPVDEYLDLFDRAETRRVRTLVRELLASYGTPGQQQELREAVRTLNAEVQKLAKHDLLRADVDVVGDLAAGGKAALGTNVIANLIVSILGLKTVKAAGAQVLDALVEDTKVGDALDAVRGKINRTPAAAVRLFRIRSRLGESKKK